MAWVSPSTRTTGDLITAAIWNADVVANPLALYSGVMDYVCIIDRKAQNTSGGTFTSGAWRTRDLNTEIADAQGLATVAANQVTLAAGTYRVAASAPGYRVATHMTRLQNATAATTLLMGSSQYIAAVTLAVSRSVLAGRFTVAASQALELQHYCGTTEATDGFGQATNIDVET